MSMLSEREKENKQTSYQTGTFFFSNFHLFTIHFFFLYVFFFTKIDLEKTSRKFQTRFQVQMIASSELNNRQATIKSVQRIHCRILYTKHYRNIRNTSYPFETNCPRNFFFTSLQYNFPALIQSLYSRPFLISFSFFSYLQKKTYRKRRGE